MTIKEWQVYCHKVAVEKGWWNDYIVGGVTGNEENWKAIKINRNPLEIAALLHSEISEFVEDIRHNLLTNQVNYIGDKPIGPPIELADLAIRLLDCCEAWGIDLEKMIEIKMKYNETRPYRHGNKIA